jgi:ATP-dependent Lon protease
MANFNIKAGYIEYDVNFITYDQNGFVTSNCNSITFINYGSNTVTIESVVLTQNQSLTIDGNAGEIMHKQFLATFTGAGTNNLVTIKKNYL